MLKLQSQLQAVLCELPKNILLIAVSKTHEVSKIQELYDAGYKCFGESRPQELKEKYNLLPKDIEWHMIGSLQKNKVKYIAPFVHLIHSVDSLALLSVINKEGLKNNRKIHCLLQLKIAKEATKSGLSYHEAVKLLESEDYKDMQNIELCGVMGMATYTEDKTIVRSEFATLKEYFEILKNTFFTNNTQFKEISMGMSGDYITAIEEGSTMVRIGSRIFGYR